jgi:hypothetical protein
MIEITCAWTAAGLPQGQKNFSISERRVIESLHAFTDSATDVVRSVAHWSNPSSPGILPRPSFRGILHVTRKPSWMAN